MLPFVRSRRAVATAALAVVPLALAACGGDRSGGPKGTPQEIVGGAPQRTIDAGSAHVVIAGEKASATGVVDLGKGVAELDVSPDRHVVLAGTTAYVSKKGGDGTWTKQDALDAFPPTLEAADPFVAVDLVRGVVKIDPWGGGEVRGASAFRYRVDIDVRKAAAAAPPERAPLLQRLAQEAGEGVMKGDVFVDSSGRLRRVQLPAEMRTGTPPTRVDGEVIAVTIDFCDFGTPANIVVPPPPSQGR